MSNNRKPFGVENWIPETRSRLAQRRAKKPDTKAGQIWALWPEIKAALQNGQSVKSIRAWLEEDAGIVVGTTSLTSYISRSRRREKAALGAEMGSAPKNMTAGSISVEATFPPKSVSATPPRDPIGQAMQALTKPRLDIKKIHGDGDPTNKNLI